MAKIKSSLRLIDNDLAQRVERASRAQLRALALEACKYALEKSALDHPMIAQAMELLTNGKCGSDALRQQVQSLVDELDERQWDIQEEVERGEAKRDRYVKAFAQARAANAVFYALDESPKVAGIEALYEAHATTGNVEEIKQVVGKVLGKKID